MPCFINLLCTVEAAGGDAGLETHGDSCPKVRKKGAVAPTLLFIPGGRGTGCLSMEVRRPATVKVIVEIFLQCIYCGCAWWQSFTQTWYFLMLFCSPFCLSFPLVVLILFAGMRACILGHRSPPFRSFFAKGALFLLMSFLLQDKDREAKGEIPKKKFSVCKKKVSSSWK